ncbi:glycosyltransferase [Mastigocladopsis repens]|uniref:glycosyltransferase n=1 Tax=Mastigocladopsis repens TaxID=221287 RepID=UPI0002F33C3E|nr:glycosyltransferase [Mastigocladopsis repens]
MWRRIKAFSQVGVELQLISWFRSYPKNEEIAEIKKYVREIYLIPFRYTLSSTVRRTLDLFRYPLEVTSRIVRGQELSRLLEEVPVFAPQVIWLDGIHGGEVATELRKHLNIPLVTRCHNVEHLYYRRLFTFATGLNKLKRYLSLSHLESYEKNLLSYSSLFYDISVDDLKFWQSQGFTNGRYLPPIVEFNKDRDLETSDNEQGVNYYDIVFLGNLYSNNNVAGIVWFLTEVLPVIRSVLPNVKVLIAGANPVQKIKQLCEENEGVHLSINPASSVAVYNSGRVLINPVLTGSGVSIKSLEMLTYGRPIVSTPQGIAGLPEAVKKYFKIAANAQSFGEEITKFLFNPQKNNVDREVLERLFGSQVIEGVISDIKSLL